MSEEKPTGNEDHPSNKSFGRKINTITLHVLGILHVILNGKYLFQGMLPHQETQDVAGRSTKSAVQRSLLSSGSRLAIGAGVSFFGGLLLLIYLYY